MHREEFDRKERLVAGIQMSNCRFDFLQRAHAINFYHTEIEMKNARRAINKYSQRAPSCGEICRPKWFSFRPHESG
jgi:hypothetical protein